MTVADADLEKTKKMNAVEEFLSLPCQCSLCNNLHRSYLCLRSPILQTHTMKGSESFGEIEIEVAIENKEKMRFEVAFCCSW